MTKPNPWYAKPAALLSCGVGAIVGGVGGTLGCLPGAFVGAAAALAGRFAAVKIQNPGASCNSSTPISKQAECAVTIGGCTSALLFGATPLAPVAVGSGLAVGSGVAKKYWTEQVRRQRSTANGQRTNAQGNRQNLHGQAVAYSLTAQYDNFQMNETVPGAEWRYKQFTQANQTMAR